MTSQGQAEWATSGLYPDHPDGASFLGITPLSPGDVAVPREAAIDGEYVTWEFTDMAFGRSAGLLDALVTLTSAPAVVRFVRRYGPINFCRDHQLPIGHNPIPANPATDDRLYWQLSSGRPYAEPSSIPDIENYCMVDRVPGTYVCREYVASYLILARQFQAGLTLAAKLKEARPGDPTADLGEPVDWTTFTMGLIDSPPLHSGGAKDNRLLTAAERVYVARWWFVTFLRELSDLARMRPGIDWRKDEDPKFMVEPDAFGVVLLQLMHAVSGTHGIAVCYGCNSAYARERKPQAGRRNYCPACRTSGKPWRDAKRDERAGKSKHRKAKEI